MSKQQFHVVQANESLATIARKLYGKEELWRKIYEANKDEIGPDPRFPRVGMNLIIPRLDSDDYINSENDQKTNGHIPSSEQDKQKIAEERGWLKRLKISRSNIKLGAWITGILGVTLSLINLYKFAQEQPRLNLISPAIQFTDSGLTSPYTDEIINLYYSVSTLLDNRLRKLIDAITDKCETSDLGRNSTSLVDSFDLSSKRNEFEKRPLVCKMSSMKL